MSEGKRTSFEDILKRRQEETFVGRGRVLADFNRNLRYAPDDRRRCFVINVSGPGGVGKTWLVRRFRKLAEGLGALTAYSDEAEDDVLPVMGRIAKQFEAQGHPLQGFARRYQTYLQHCKEIEADPQAPQGFPAGVGRALVKGGVRLARRVPVGGVLAEFVDEDAFAAQMGEFASYVARKIGRKDEVQLVLDPVQDLTALFVADLRKVAEAYTLALFFDTYERTGDYLDAWLRELLAGRHGEMPVDFVIVIAGRDGLDANRWASYAPVLGRLSLEPFTEDEARKYLKSQGITNERVVQVILDLSGRLPLLVATLAAEGPTDPGKVGDPSGDAVERFLRWVEDPKRRRVALNAAVPRTINRDILAVLTGEEEADDLFDWLKAKPFVRDRSDGWVYHEVVRAQMLRYKRRESPQGWRELHGQLAAYYGELRDGLGLEGGACQQDEVWRGYALESVYHGLCERPQEHLAEALSGFVAAFDARRHFAYHYAETMAQAGKEGHAQAVANWGARLMRGTVAYLRMQPEEAADMLTALLEQPALSERARAVALSYRGMIYRLMERYGDALADYDEAVLLDADEVWTIAHRGLTQRLMGRYDAALADFDRAIALNPDDGWVIAHRGMVYRLMERYGEALADFSRAIALDPRDSWTIASRGLTYRLTKRYDDALADFSRAVALNPGDSWTVAGRGEVFLQMGRYAEAMADFDRAIELNPSDAWANARQGEIYRRLRRRKKALDSFDRAITLDPDYAWAVGRRGLTLKSQQHYAEALKDFDRAIELDPDCAWALAARAEIYLKRRRLGEALSDLNRAIDLQPNDARTLSRRGDTHRRLGNLEQALIDFDRAVALRPDDAWNIASRGALHRRLGHLEAALADFDRAIELKPNDSWAIAGRAETYQLLGRYEEALEDVDRAIRLRPNYVWATASRGTILRRLERYEEALADLDQAIASRPDNGWYLFNRALVYLALGQTDEAQADLEVAISGHREKREEHPQDWPNTLGLAVCQLAAGESEAPERLFREALDGGAPSSLIQGSMRSVDDLVRLFPDRPQPRAMRELLREHLQQGEDETALEAEGGPAPADDVA